MTLFEVVILGLIQGLTEFIPVSSSGHLVLMHQAFGVTTQTLAFDVALHGGTLLALLAYFWRDVVELAQSLLRKNDKTHRAHLLILATLPAASIGYALSDSGLASFRSAGIVAGTMIVFGLVMLLAEKIYIRKQQHDSLRQITAWQAVAMGFAQAVALIPGVSRSGSTITAGLLTGLDRVAATRFSFLLGIPITFGAILKVFSEGNAIGQVGDEKTAFIVGIITAMLSGLFAIRFMIHFLDKHGLHVFAYYRIGLGLLTLLLLAVR